MQLVLYSGSNNVPLFLIYKCIALTLCVLHTYSVFT